MTNSNVIVAQTTRAPMSASPPQILLNDGCLVSLENIVSEKSPHLPTGATLQIQKEPAGSEKGASTLKTERPAIEMASRFSCSDSPALVAQIRRLGLSTSFYNTIVAFWFNAVVA